MNQKASVLFVDDEPRVLNSMRGMFRRKFDLHLASDGETAVDIASQKRIDVIVADQRMPGMTGTEVLGRVKELSPDTIRILLTGYADPTAVESSINDGEVFRFLSKPCTPQVLRHTLDTAIKAARPVKRPEPVREAASKPPEPPVLTTSQSGKDLPDLPTEIRAEHLDEQAIALERARDIGVVLYTVDAQFAEQAIRAISPERRISLATSLIKVMQQMENRQNGVLITDIVCNNVQLQGIIATLKRYVPELVTIVVSNDSDTNDMIDLINCGQIFRYLRKPVTPLRLHMEIAAAAVKHVELKDHRELQQRHNVAAFPDRKAVPGAVVESVKRVQRERTLRANASRL